MDLRTTLLLVAGGAAGTLARYGVCQRLNAAFPWGTMAVNVGGAFLIGLVGTLCERQILSPQVRTAVVAGFLGAFTTFSALTWESWSLAQRGQWGAAALNVGLSVAAGFAGLALGVGAARLA